MRNDALNIREMRPKSAVCRGLFWYIESDLVTVKLPCDLEGNFIGEIPVSLKGKPNLTHSEAWKSLTKTVTNRKEFNHYPRGRVEVVKGKAKIFLNPDICKDDVIDKIKTEFNLNDLVSVKVIADGSKHYQYKK